MRRRGAALQLVLLVIAVVAAGALLLQGHTRATLATREADERRTQALWLARSVLYAAGPVNREVDTAAGRARVETIRGPEGTKVRVSLGGARAEVTGTPYTERYEPAP